MAPGRTPAAWPAYAKLLPVLLPLVIYLVVMARFPSAVRVKWQATTTPAIPVTPGSTASTSSKAAPAAATPDHALLEAAKKPVVIGLQRSGQWPFWQAMHAPHRISDLGVRANTSMSGPTMDAQHPDWVSSSCEQQQL
jgi:hypothetical protein